MFQLTVSVTSLDQLYTLSGHLAELDFLSESAVVQPAATLERGEAPASGGEEDRRATERQLQYLNDLARKAGWQVSVFEEQVKELHGLDDISQLTKQMASDLITQLQDNDLPAGA